MDTQTPIPQATIPADPPVVQPVTPQKVSPPKKNGKWIWIIAGFIVLLIGVLVGVFLRK